MKRLLTAVLLISFLASARGADASLDGSIGGARSQGMGGAFVSVADDGSAIFVNQAGMVSALRPGVYLDYGGAGSGGEIRESRVGLGAPVRGIEAGIGWFRRDVRGGATGDLFIIGAARRLVEGTQGSFLSVGVGVSVGRSAGSEGWGDDDDRSTTSAVTADAGIILRPLPVISFGYSAWNVRDANLGAAPGVIWSRVQRWGVSYFWEEKVILSFEQEHGGRGTRLHYGLSVKTGAPLELMVGFSEGSAAGGVRWVGKRIRAALAFESGAGNTVAWTGSCEIALHRPTTEGAM
jgi:hypothetical protein